MSAPEAVLEINTPTEPVPQQPEPAPADAPVAELQVPVFENSEPPQLEPVNLAPPAEENVSEAVVVISEPEPPAQQQTAPQPVSRIKPGFPLRPRIAAVPEPPPLSYELDSNSDAYQHALNDTLSSSISNEMRKMQTDAIQERNEFTRKSVDSLVSRYFEQAQRDLEKDD
jgi:hypothetical protein